MKKTKKWRMLNILIMILSILSILFFIIGCANPVVKKLVDENDDNSIDLFELDGGGSKNFVYTPSSSGEYVKDCNYYNSISGYTYIDAKDNASEGTALHAGYSEQNEIVYSITMNKTITNAIFELRYSDDVQGNNIKVYVNGVEKGNFTSVDTSSGDGGDYWDSFYWLGESCWSGSVGNSIPLNMTFNEGETYTIKLVVSANSYGVNLDLFRIVNTYTPPFHITYNGNDMGVRYIDLNGDGKEDMVYYRYFYGNIQKGAYINQNGSWVSAPNYTPPFHIAIDGEGDAGVRFIDLNGDGLKDMVYYRYFGTGSIQKGAYINQNGSWVSASNYTPPFHITYNGNDMGVRFIDLNGDGKEDMVYYRYFGSGSIQKGAYINQNGSWVSVPSYAPPFHITIDGVGDVGMRFIDLNGDGLKDIIYYRWFNGNIQKGAWINNGSGWVSVPNYAPPFHIAIDGVGDVGMRFIDLNGDGLKDIVYYRYWWQDGHQTQKGAWINNGSGWESVPNYYPPFHIAIDGEGDAGVRFIDLNGDGLKDMVYYRYFGSGSIQRGAYINSGTSWVKK